MGYGWNDPSAIPPPGLFQLQRAGVLVTQHTMLQVDVVFTALRIIDNHVMAMGNPRAYSEKVWGPDNVIYHQYAKTQPDILTDTWGNMPQTVGMSRTVWSLGLYGEAFWYVLLRDGRQPSAIDVLHPAFMEIKPATVEDVRNGFAANVGDEIYVYGTGQNKVVLDPEDVIHIPFKSLPGARRAMSPIEYAGVAGALAMAAYEFGSTWFSQGASPDFILSTDAKLGQAEVERIAQKFLIEHSGLSTSHLPLVLDSGLKAEKVMAAPDESQYLQTLEFARSVIASWFGINEEWLGNALQKLSPPAPGAFEDQQRRFNLHTLTGFLAPIEEAISTRLLMGESKAKFMRGELEQPSIAAQAQLVLALRNSQSYTQNDARVRIQHIPPIAGGDEMMAPLASNVAPGQTKKPDEPPAKSPKPSVSEGDGK